MPPIIAARAFATLFAAVLIAALVQVVEPAIALGAVAAIAATAAAAAWPAVWMGLLLAVVVLQDWLVALGLDLAQAADEALVLAGVAGIVVRWAMRRAMAEANGVGSVVTRTPVDLATLGFVAAGLVAAVIERVPPVVAGLGLVALLKGLLAFQIGARVPVGDRAIRRGVRWGLGLVGLLALVGLVQRLGGEPVYRLTGQAEHFAMWAGSKTPSLFFNHNAFGHVLVLGGALALGLAITAHGGVALGGEKRAPLRYPWGRATTGILILLGLILSGSREAWLATVTGMAAVAVALRSRRLVWGAAIVAMIVAIGGAAVYLGSPPLREELARRLGGVGEGWRLFRLGFTGWEFRGEYRVYIALKSWQIFLDHPLFGTGPGRFGGFIAVRYLTPIYERYAFLPLDGAYIPLDVFWSRLLTEFGLVGTACYLAAFAAAVRIHAAAIRHADALTRGLAIGGLGATVAVAVLGVFAPALEDPLTAVPVWLWTGVVWRRGYQARLAMAATATVTATDDPSSRVTALWTHPASETPISRPMP